jgi:hypothetical protein
MKRRISLLFYFLIKLFMKIILLIIGIVISLFAIIKILLIDFSGKGVSGFGLGYLLGNIILVAVGSLLIYFALKKRKHS